MENEPVKQLIDAAIEDMNAAVDMLRYAKAQIDEGYVKMAIVRQSNSENLGVQYMLQMNRKIEEAIALRDKFVDEASAYRNRL